MGWGVVCFKLRTLSFGKIVSWRRLNLPVSPSKHAVLGLDEDETKPRTTLWVLYVFFIHEKTLNT